VIQIWRHRVEGSPPPSGAKRMQQKLAVARITGVTSFETLPKLSWIAFGHVVCPGNNF